MGLQPWKRDTFVVDNCATRKAPLRFLLARHARLGEVVPADLFDYLDWQECPTWAAGAKVVRLAARRGAAPASMNRRIAAVRGLFEFAVTRGQRTDNPVPAARQLQRLARKAAGPARPHRCGQGTHRWAAAPPAARIA